MFNSGAPAGALGSSSEPVLSSYVDLLRQVARLTHDSTPTYRVEMEGMPDKPFRCIVRVGTENFPSSHYFAQHDEAKEDAARVAYEKLSARENICDEFARAFHLIDQDETLCMVILNDFCKRANIAIPLHYVVKPEDSSALFIADVSVGGNTYTGERANTEEQAKKNAARTAVKSILATRNGCMLEIIFSKIQTGITIQERQPSTMNVPPVMTTASLPSGAYTPCACNELVQRQPSNMAFLPHEQMQQCPPMSFFWPHELMKRSACVTSTASEMKQMLLPSDQAIPAGDVVVLPPEISANEYQDDNMMIEDEQMQQYHPPCPPFLFPHELMKPKAGVASTTYETMQMLLPSHQAITAGDVTVLPPRGISANEYQDDNMMVIDEVDHEESESLSGKKRKMDANEGPVDKQARTV